MRLKTFFNAGLGITTEILYTLLIMLAAFLACLIFFFRI